MGTGSRDEASMRRIVGYRELCAWAGLELMRKYRFEEWQALAARRAAGFAGKVIAANGQGAAEIDVPEDPSWLLLP